MPRRPLISQLAVVAAGLLIALGAANVAYTPEITTQEHAHDAAVSERNSRDVGLHVGIIKTERSQRLLRFGLAVLATASLAVALSRRRVRPRSSRTGRLGFAAGSLGRGPPLLRVR